MTFLWMPMLLLLGLVPAFVGLYIMLIRRRKKAAVRYANLSLIRQAAGRGPGFRKHIPPLLFLLSVTVLIVAIARPAAVVSLPSQRGTIIMAMDISGSMRARDIPPNRITASQEAARAFVSAQPGNVRIGVVAFAATATIVQPATTDREDVLAAIERFRTQWGTAIGSGILTSLEALFEEENLFDGGAMMLGNSGSEENSGSPLGAPRQEPAPGRQPVAPGSNRSAAIVLLTDGQTTQGPDPLEAAAVAADLGVRIYTVGLGTEEGEILGLGGWSMRVQLDEPTLKAIAELTGGRYFRAETVRELHDIYRLLGSDLIVETEKTEITALFAAAGALLAMASVFLSVLWWNRVA